MTPERWQRLKVLFQEAAPLAPEARPEFLRERCGADDDLRRELAALLASHDDRDWLLPEEAAEGAPLVGLRLGSYTILRRVPRGGMGEVFLAERGDAAYDKRVAIKVIRTDA